MKLLLNEFCCLAPLRSGCFIIGFFMIVTASMYLFGYVSHIQQDDHRSGKEKNEFFYHDGNVISLIGCAFNYIIGAILLIGVYKDVSVMLLMAVALLLLNTVFDVAAAAYSGIEGYVGPCVSLLLYAALMLYFALVVYSYNIEIKELQKIFATMNEESRAEFEQERIRAKEQGLPDPMKAALRKYRAPLDEERDPHKPTSAKPKEEASTS